MVITTPDVSFNVQHLRQLFQASKDSHMNVATRVLKYVKNQPRLGVVFPVENNLHLTAYCDSNWAEGAETMRSATVYYIKLGNSWIFWKVKKQSIVNMSTISYVWLFLRLLG